MRAHPLGDVDSRGVSSACHLLGPVVDLDPVEDDDDVSELRELIEFHLEYTGSSVAERILEEWPDVLSQFVKVMPTDYKRVLAERRRHDEEIESPIRDVDQTGGFKVVVK